MEAIAALEHVEIVSPVLELGVLAKYGSYESNLNLRGMSVEALQKMNIELSEGRLPEKGLKKLELVYGNQVITDFRNVKTNDSYWMSGKLPDINLMEDPVFVIFDTDYQFSDRNEAMSYQDAISYLDKKLARQTFKKYNRIRSLL